MARDWVIAHELGHFFGFLAAGVPVHSIEVEPNPHVRPCSGHLTCLQWASVICAGAVAQHIYHPEADDHLREAVGGDVALLLKALEEPTDKESVYTTALIGEVVSGRVHPLLPIPEEHRRLLRAAVSEAKLILEENSSLGESLADALKIKNSLNREEIEALQRTNKEKDTWKNLQSKKEMKPL